MAGPKRLGIPADLYCRPLIARLNDSDGFAIQVDTPARLAARLRDRELDVALIGPVEYARESSGYEIVPGVGVSSIGASGTACLFFRDELETIATVAVDAASPHDAVLARIVLAEEFDFNPSFTPLQGEVDDTLLTTDAVLLSGDRCLRALDRLPHRIDLVESWEALTGLPLVHGIWCTVEGALTPDDIRTLQRLGTDGMEAVDSVLRHEREVVLTPDFPLSQFPDFYSAFSYGLDEEALDGLQEFLRYCFYLGITPDIAEVNFAGSREQDAEAG